MSRRKPCLHHTGVIIGLLISSISCAAPERVTGSATATVDAGDVTAVKHAATRAHLWGAVPTFIAPEDVMYGTDQGSRAYLHAASELARSAHRLADMVRQHLGERALEPLMLNFPTEAGLERQLKEGGDPFFTDSTMDKVRVRIHNGEADITDAAGQHEHARRIEGTWKIAVASDELRAQEHFDPGLLKKATEAALKEAAFDDKLAADVQTGKLHTTEQVRNERERGKEQIYSDIASPETAPASRPASSNR